MSDFEVSAIGTQTELARLQTLLDSQSEELGNVMLDLQKAEVLRDKLITALEEVERVLLFDLAQMRQFGPVYNQAVVDAGNIVSVALISKAKGE